MALPLLKLSDEFDSPFSSCLFSTSTLPQNSTYEITNLARSWIFDYNLTVNASSATGLAGTATGGVSSQYASASLSSLTTLNPILNPSIGKTYPAYNTSGNSTGTGTIGSIQLPPTIPGQIIFLFLHKAGVQTYSTQPTGFTSVGTALQVSGTADSGSVWYKIADGSEAYQTYTASWTTSVGWAMSYAIYDFPSQTSPINAVTSSVLAASTAPTLPSVTSTVGYTTAIYVAMTFLSGTAEALTYGTGVTTRFNNAVATGSITIADKTNGTVGTASGTNTGGSTPDSATELCWTIALATTSLSPLLYSESSTMPVLTNITSSATNLGGGTGTVESWGMLSIN